MSSAPKHSREKCIITAVDTSCSTSVLDQALEDAGKKPDCDSSPVTVDFKGGWKHLLEIP